jgi:hypothetical protein
MHFPVERAVISVVEVLIACVSNKEVGLRLVA